MYEGEIKRTKAAYSEFESGLNTFAWNQREDVINEFTANNEKAFVNSLQGAQNINDAANGGGNANLTNSIAGEGGKMLAGALGVPDEVGYIVGKFIGLGINSAVSGNKKNNRVAEDKRDGDGFGIKPTNTIEPYKFNFKGNIMEVRDWGDHISFWDRTNQTNYRGYGIWRNGMRIADAAVYVWIDGNDLYMQANLMPWETEETAGKIFRYIGQSDKMWELVGKGVPNNPKAINIKQPDAGGIERKSATVPQNLTPMAQGDEARRMIQLGLNPVAPSAVNPNNITPNGASPPIVGGNDSLGPETQNEAKNDKPKDEKKDNTMLYVGIGVGVLILIAILVFALKK